MTITSVSSVVIKISSASTWEAGLAWSSLDSSQLGGAGGRGLRLRQVAKNLLILDSQSIKGYCLEIANCINRPDCLIKSI